jgi:lantibiotic modifying enzyme
MQDILQELKVSQAEEKAQAKKIDNIWTNMNNRVHQSITPMFVQPIMK